MSRQPAYPPAKPARSSAPRLVALAAASTMVVAACGGSADPEELAFTSSTTATSEATTGATTSTTEAASTTVPVVEPEEQQPTTPTTAGSGLGPVQTIAVDPGGDPDGIYRGILGELALTEQVAPAAVPAPTVADGILPLNGLPGQVPDRPAAVVKVDNGPAAVPQTGLAQADLVIEEEVEGGVTRFAAVFHSTPSIVGPVRSGRTTDLSLISGFEDPLLIYSGANRITEGILRSNTAIQNRSHGSAAGGYWRADDRSAPSNLYSDTAPHWDSATGGPPPPQFHYRSPGVPAVGATSDQFTVTYGASSARWEWDGDRWLRWQRGAPHTDVDGTQLRAENVVVIATDKVDTGMTDSSGGAVPELVFVGSGQAVVFTDGQRIEGIWTRPTLSDVATLTDADGLPIGLTPGQTWIQMVETNAGALR